VVRINEHETLSYGCDECDGIGYSKKGEGRYAKWLAKITRVKPAGDPPADVTPRAVTSQVPTPKPAPAAAVPPAKKSGLLIG
jgi:hypothetical protein